MKAKTGSWYNSSWGIETIAQPGRPTSRWDFSLSGDSIIFPATCFRIQSSGIDCIHPFVSLETTMELCCIFSWACRRFGLGWEGPSSFIAQRRLKVLLISIGGPFWMMLGRRFVLSIFHRGVRNWLWGFGFYFMKSYFLREWRSG